MENFFLTTNPGTNVPDLLIKEPSGLCSLRKTEKKSTANGFSITETLMYLKDGILHRDDDEPSVIISEKIENVKGEIVFYNPKYITIDAYYPIKEPKYKIEFDSRFETDFFVHVKKTFEKYAAAPLQLSKITKLWFKDGLLHRENRPAMEYTIEIADDRPTIYEQRSLAGKPTVISEALRRVFVSVLLQKFMQNGKLCNDAGSAIVYDFKDMIHQEYDHREYYVKGDFLIDPNFALTKKAEKKTIDEEKKSIEEEKKSIEEEKKKIEEIENEIKQKKGYLDSLKTENERYRNLSLTFQN